MPGPLTILMIWFAVRPPLMLAPPR